MSDYRRGNYIGVSGVTSPEQQSELREHANAVFAELDVTLAIGVKAVHKTQWLDVENKYGKEWYPVGEAQFANALAPGTSENIAQVYLDPTELARDPQYATNFVRRIKQRGQNWLHAIQFDLLPYLDNPEALGYVVHEAHRDTDGLDPYVIVQCHEDAMNEGPEVALDKLKRLSPDEIGTILFDASHGKGQTMDPDQLKRFLEAAFGDHDLAGVSFGVAGGLDATAVQAYIPGILKDFPQISWDAEGKVHQTADGRLDMDAAKAYLTASAEALRSI